jgi:hypothetical protein
VQHNICAQFTVRLVDDADWSSKNRRLLNTEKIIFKAEGRNPVSADQSSAVNQNELNLLLVCIIPIAFINEVIFLTAVCDQFQVYVLVIVEPEGVVAKPNVPEREDALFNIGMALVSHYNSL